MKILIIQTNAIDKNGVTNVVFNYLRAFPEGSVTVDMFSKNDPAKSYKEEVKRHRGQIYYYPRTYKNIVQRWNFLRKLIKSNHYDIIHVHCNSHVIIPELLAAKVAGCKVRIVHSHNTTTSYPLLHNLLTPIFNSLYTHGFACGEAAGKWMFGNRKFKIINNGIDITRYAFNPAKRKSVRDKLELSESDILIGHVGHFLGDVKNQTFIVKIFNALIKHGSYKLCLIGDGPQKALIEKQVRDYGLDNRQVIFTGNIECVDSYLNAIDIIVMPSLYEGLPLTLIEQQANGLICLCSDVITKEVDKTGNLKFLSLQEPIENWVHTLQESVNVSARESYSKIAIELITKAGYNIHKEGVRLLDLYSSYISNTIK